MGTARCALKIPNRCLKKIGHLGMSGEKFADSLGFGIAGRERQRGKSQLTLASFRFLSATGGLFTEVAG